jgi:hypothetical protein
MRKGLLITATCLSIMGCSQGDVVVLNDQSDRISELERRADLNDQLDSLQSQLIQANADAIAAETAARESADTQLEADLQQEIADRIAGDATLSQMLADEQQAREDGDTDLAMALQNEIDDRIAGDDQLSRRLRRALRRQSLVNAMVQDQLRQVNRRVSRLKTKLHNLKLAVDDNTNDITALQVSMSDVQQDMLDLDTRLSAEIDEVEADLATTQAQLDAQGVQVLKCNSPSSTERMFKINGKIYAVMNRVTTASVKVITGTTSQSYSTPDMCETVTGNLKLPNTGGQCTPVSGPFASTLVPGTTVVVPSNTTQNVTVVTGVKMALDILSDGSYVTTDGGPACSFSISGGGSSSTNLIPVQ